MADVATPSDDAAAATATNGTATGLAATAFEAKNGVNVVALLMLPMLPTVDMVREKIPREGPHALSVGAVLAVLVAAAADARPAGKAADGSNIGGRPNGSLANRASCIPNAG